MSEQTYDCYYCGKQIMWGYDPSDPDGNWCHTETTDTECAEGDTVADPGWL